MPDPILSPTRAPSARAFPRSPDELRELLGARLVAYLGSVQETRAVHQWVDATRTPSEETQQRLRVALQVALTIASAESARIAQAWFQGLNPQLEDRSPARLLRDGELRGGRTRGDRGRARVPGRRMTPPLASRQPDTPIHRISRRPDAWAWPDWALRR